MRPSNQERIEALRSRRAQIDVELSRLEAKARATSRKIDTRKKILVGAVVLHEMEQNPELMTLIERLLRSRLTKPRDRVLFKFDEVTP